MEYEATIGAKRSFNKGKLKGAVKIYFIRSTGLSVIVLQEDYDKLLKKLGVDSLRGKKVKLIVMCHRCCKCYRCSYLMIVDDERINILNECPQYRPITGDTNG